MEQKSRFSVFAVSVLLLVATDAAGSVSGGNYTIDVKAIHTSQTIYLACTLHNTQPSELRLYENYLPWKPAGLQLWIFREHAPTLPMQRTNFIKDSYPNTITLPPRGKLYGQIDLGSEFAELANWQLKAPLIIFWIYCPSGPNAEFITTSGVANYPVKKHAMSQVPRNNK